MQKHDCPAVQECNFGRGGLGEREGPWIWNFGDMLDLIDPDTAEGLELENQHCRGAFLRLLARN